MCNGKTSIDTSNLLLLRTLKPLRIVKLFKALKLLRLLKEELAIALGITFVKSIVLFAYLLYSVHFCSCGYWRVKLETNTDEEIATFLESRKADPQVLILTFWDFSESLMTLCLYRALGICM